MKVSKEVAKYVETRAHPVRFFRTSNEKTHYESTFWGKFGNPQPFDCYTCCWQEAVQEAFGSAEVQSLPAKKRLSAAWDQARQTAIDWFVEIANALTFWESQRKKNPSIAHYETFTNTGWYDMNGVGGQIATACRCGDYQRSAAIFDNVKWTFSIDYNWKMLRLFRRLQRSDVRSEPIPPRMVTAMNRLIAEITGEVSLFTRVFIESYFSGYLFPRDTGIAVIVGTRLGELIGPAFLLSAAQDQGANVPTVEAILKAYGTKIVLCDYPVFGDQSIFRNFTDRHERELGAVRTAFDAIVGKSRQEHEAQGYCERSSAVVMTNLLDQALKLGLVRQDWAGMITEVRAVINLFPDFYQPAVGSECRIYLGEVEARYKRTTGTRTAGIKGTGLETANSASSATEIYLDGNLLAIAVRPIFSDKPCGNNRVAWSTCVQMDQGSLKGQQFQLTVYAAGVGEPVHELWSGNFYTKMSYLSVTTPTVDSNGIISFTVDDGQNKREHVVEPLMAIA